MLVSKPRKVPIGGRNIVGSRIVQIRKAKKIKQKDLVAALQTRGMDISDTGMSRLEGQNRLVQDFELPILAQTLGVSVEYLLGLKEE